MVLSCGGAFSFLDDGIIDLNRLPASLLANYLAFEEEAGTECLALSMRHRRVIIALDRIANEWNESAQGVDWKTDD